MNNIYMKKKYTKKKARGFSKITGKTRISRAQAQEQKKQLSDAYDDIIKKLSSSDREKLNKTMNKFQKTFKQKLQDKKTKRKKTPAYKSSKYYKTLQEIPAPLLDKILRAVPLIVIFSLFLSITSKFASDLLSIVRITSKSTSSSKV